MDKEKLIVSLIKDDLINSKFVNGLDKLGLDSGNYLLHLSDTIFKLMGFPDDHHTEEVYFHYIQQRKRADKFKTQSHKPFEELAKDLYLELIRRKPKKK